MPTTARKFEDIVTEYEAEGLDTTELRAAWDASPLRRERDEAKTSAASALERAQRAEAKALASSFKDLGIKVSPTALRMPDDLDVTDDAALRTWAEGAGLVEPPAPTTATQTEQAAHQQAANASQGVSTTEAPQDTYAEAIASAKTPAEVLAAVRAAGGVVASDLE